MAVHIFNGFQNTFGGSENEALDLARALRDRTRVQLWATSSRADPGLMARESIARVRPAGRHPDGGTYVFVGSHWRNKLWPYLVPAPRRLIYVFNTFHPKHAALTGRHRALLRWPKTEYVFISDFQRRRLGMDGEVHPSPIDLSRFPFRAARRSQPVVVGRLSRDTPSKHHAEDPALYAALAAEGMAVRLQGARSVATAFAAHPAIEIFEEGRQEAAAFLHGLDVFVYRTGTDVETFGRVVVEAMACGLPVVCHRFGGYADHIRHGENGFLFENTAEAASQIRMLASDAELRARVGLAARRTVEVLYGAEASAGRIAFYLR